MKSLYVPYRFFILLLAGWVLLSSEVAAAAEELLKTNYSYRKFNVLDGLPENPCYSLMQDSRGFIWVGTLNGFARYDGQSFKSFHHESDEGILGLSENEKGEVVAISYTKLLRVAQKGDSLLSKVAIWENGLYRDKMSRYLPENYGIYGNGESNVLFAITDSGLTKVFEHEILNQMSEDHPLYWDKNSERFFISTKQGVYIVNENGVVEKEFAAKYIYAITSYRNRIIAVAFNGIYEYDGDELKQIYEYPFYTGGSLSMCVLEDADHNLIIGMENAIYRYAGGRIEVIADQITQLYDIMLDKEGNLWVATVDGVYNFFRLGFKNYKLLPEGTVAMSIVADQKNRIWLSSLDGTLVSMEDDKPHKIDYPPSRYTMRFFYRGAEIIGNDIYFPGSGDVLKYNIGDRKFKWLGLPDNIYIYIKPISDEIIMIGGHDMIYIYQQGKGVIKTYNAEEEAEIARILCAETDRQGRIWFGGTEGIAIVEGDTIRKLRDDILKSCRYMVDDKTGRMWLGCLNNLVVSDGQDIRLVHSFPNTLIRNIFITRDNIMLVSTIDAMYVSKNNDYTEFIRYDQYNGFNALGPLSVSMAEDLDGYVWLLTLDNAVRFNPDKLLFDQPVPVLHLTQMQISDDNIQWNPFLEGQSRIGHNNRNIKFSYIGLCYSAIGNLSYQYRLKGFQEEWSTPTSDREVTFNNLPPGHYEFQIKANSGAEGTETDVIGRSFIISPAFWQTWWFASIAALSLILAVTGTALYIQRRKNGRMLRQMEIEKQLNELRVKSIRLRSIPHFNANVLAAIEYYVMNQSKDEANRLLGIYSEFTTRTLREVDKASRSLCDELDYVLMYLKLEKLRFLEKFDYEINIDPEVKQEVQLPNMILHTYCENAVKHGFSSRSSDCHLKISARQKGDLVEVSVEDNGVGRIEASQNKSIRSTKQGLDILSRQIEIYNRFNEKKIVQRVFDLYDGEIPLGTRFTIEVPYGFVYQ
jgi:Putative regulator of cell autolysis